jgi:hypothetical protein
MLRKFKKCPDGLFVADFKKRHDRSGKTEPP